MDLELYKAEKLNQKGSSLRKSMQNNTTPVLDLFVREAVQNSLDARDDNNRHKYVNVDFTVGTFDRKAMEKELPGVPFDKMPWGNKFIAVRDSYTTGLTGSYEKKSSNLFKLVYGIMEAQQASGAGGSWGIGKTVYFRVGTGLVIYYSRVKTSAGYESILAADFVEDESKKDALLPPVDGEKYGIAFWGKKIRGKDAVKETRDERTVNRMLKAFGLDPFGEDSTGTLIIIPYINEQNLLGNTADSDEEPSLDSPWWTNDLTDFLRISVQRWYSARLANKKYNGKYLNVKVNDKAIRQQDMEPFFQVTQALYNKAALTILGDDGADLISLPETEILCEEIRVNSQINPNEAGRVAFAKVSRKLLGMNPPHNCPSPYVYVNGKLDEDDFGQPILMYCRKPGMVVSYEIRNSLWVTGIPATGDDEYLIGYFVLNSDPILPVVEPELSLEDYVRKTEKVDHAAWADIDLKNEYLVSCKDIEVIKRIKKNVAKKIREALEIPVEEDGETEESGLGTLLGRVLLPPEGFGRKPSPQTSPGPGPTTTTHRNIRYSYYVERFTPDGMVVFLRASTGRKSAGSFGFEFRMDSVIGSISAAKWVEETGLGLPFILKGANLTLKSIDGSRSGMKHSVSSPEEASSGPLTSKGLVSEGDEWYGLSFGFSDGFPHQFEIELTLDVSILRKDVKPLLSFDL